MLHYCSHTINCMVGTTMLGRYDTYSEKVFVINNIFYANFQWAVNQAAQCFNGFWFFHQQWAHNTGWIELKHEKPKQQNQQNDAATWCGPRFLWSAYTIKQDTMSDMKNHPEKEKRHIQTTWCFWRTQHTQRRNYYNCKFHFYLVSVHCF